MIDIASYRCRIGCFQQKIGTKSEVFQFSPRKCNVESGKPTVKKLILRALLLLSVTASALLLTATLGPTDTLQAAQPTALSGTFCHSSATSISTVVDCIAIILPVRKYFVLGDNNFSARYTYGNKREHGIKLIHWNKGSSHLENKKDEVEALIQKFHPHILGLSESNLFSHHDLANVQLPEYTLHTCPTLSNPDLSVSRVVVYTHNSLVVKLRPDLMDDKTSAVWLEVGLPRRRKILVCNYYREWGYMRQADKSSHSIPAQLERWSAFLAQWERAIGEDKEVIVTGDININSLKWMRDDLPASDSIHKLRSLIELLFEKIIPHGISQLVTVATHSWPGQEDSCLDHVYTNKPDKLSNIAVHRNGGSDHSVICFTRYAKSLKKNVRYIRKRSFKNFDVEGFKREVSEAYAKLNLRFYGFKEV